MSVAEATDLTARGGLQAHSHGDYLDTHSLRRPPLPSTIHPAGDVHQARVTVGVTEDREEMGRRIK